MSLLLGNGEDREETINNFEDAAREILIQNPEIINNNVDLSEFSYGKYVVERLKKIQIIIIIAF